MASLAVPYPTRERPAASRRNNAHLVASTSSAPLTTTVDDSDFNVTPVDNASDVDDAIDPPHSMSSTQSTVPSIFTKDLSPSSPGGSSLVDFHGDTMS